MMLIYLCLKRVSTFFITSFDKGWYFCSYTENWTNFRQSKNGVQALIAISDGSAKLMCAASFAKRWSSFRKNQFLVDQVFIECVSPAFLTTQQFLSKPSKLFSQNMVNFSLSDPIFKIKNSIQDYWKANNKQPSKLTVKGPSFLGALLLYSHFLSH